MQYIYYQLFPLAITKGVILMNKMLIYPLPKFHTLPATLPIEGAIRIEIEEGSPILRASKSVQTRTDSKKSRCWTNESKEVKTFSY